MQEVEINGDNLLRLGYETSCRRPGNDFEWDFICYSQDLTPVRNYLKPVWVASKSPPFFHRPFRI
jgi:hypothetical protein